MLFKSAYLGDSEIVKAYKGNTLFYEKQQGGYVQDGLVLFLDGLNQGGVSGKWIDTVGNKEFTLVNATQEIDGVSFTGGYAQYATDVAFQTLEIVCSIVNSTNYMTLFTANSDRNCNIYKNANKLTFGGLSSSPSVDLTHNTVISYSALFNTTFSNIKVNNSTVTTSGGVNWSAYPYGVNIGLYNGQYQLTGKVLALRLYNRQLTDAELTQNYNLDVQRYGL